CRVRLEYRWQAIEQVATTRIQATRFRFLVLRMSISQNRFSHFWATCFGAGGKGMKYAVALLLAGLMSAFPAIAGTVSGQALDENGAPWEGVNVEVVYQTYRADQLMTYGA